MFLSDILNVPFMTNEDLSKTSNGDTNKKILPKIFNDKRKIVYKNPVTGDEKAFKFDAEKGSFKPASIDGALGPEALANYIAPAPKFQSTTNLSISETGAIEIPFENKENETISATSNIGTVRVVGNKLVYQAPDMTNAEGYNNVANGGKVGTAIITIRADKTGFLSNIQKINVGILKMSVAKDMGIINDDFAKYMYTSENIEII